MSEDTAEDLQEFTATAPLETSYLQSAGYFARRAEQVLDHLEAEAVKLDESEEYDGTPSARMMALQWKVEALVDLTRIAANYDVGLVSSDSGDSESESD